MAKSDSPSSAGHYDANYGNFQTELYAQIRQEAFGEDIGQNSWLTSDGQDRFLQWLELAPGRILLDVACGAGGPALRIAAATGCSIVGIDAHKEALGQQGGAAQINCFDAGRRVSLHLRRRTNLFDLPAFDQHGRGRKHIPSSRVKQMASFY